MAHMSAAQMSTPQLQVQDDDCEVALIHPPAVFAARAALGAMPPVPEVAGLFALLADPTRLRMLAALSAGELCVCDLAAATGIIARGSPTSCGSCARDDWCVPGVTAGSFSTAWTMTTCTTCWRWGSP